LGIFISLRKAASSTKGQLEELRSSIMPVVANTRDLLANMLDLFARVGPRIDAVSTDLAEITNGLRRQTTEIQVTADEIMDKVRRQSGRIDGMFSTVLDGVEKAGGFVAEAVGRPVRQISAVLASVKAVVDALRKPTGAERPAHTPAADKDMFV
jgi:ABC-type transporter Mla subunit MlaD